MLVAFPHHCFLQHKKAIRTLLLTKDSKVPLLWKVLASKYHGRLRFGTHRDEKNVAGSEVGVSLGESKSKVLVFSEGSQDPSVYEGAPRQDSQARLTWLN